jgi:anti-sigma regulatory factor (Ser/Thr protein kinase)
MPKETFQAKFEFLDEIRDFVGNVARQNSFSDKEVYNIQLASDEAASNIIEHAYEGVTTGRLDIDCHMEGAVIVIVMTDKGKPFDVSTVKEPNLKADLSEREIGGLGVYLMRKLMDDVHYESTANGNLLTMKKRRG